MFGHRNSNHLVFLDGVCKEYTHSSKIVEIYEVLKKNYEKLRLKGLKKVGRRSQVFSFFSELKQVLH